MNILNESIIDFELPENLACPLPTEARGMERDEVRLLVTGEDGEAIEHTTFKHLDRVLKSGDVLVVNTSSTQPAALSIPLPGGKAGRLHLSTALQDGRWLAEIRTVKAGQTVRWREGQEGQRFDLPAGGKATLKQRHYQNTQQLHLWEMKLEVPVPLNDYLHEHGFPIKYTQVDKQWPLSHYQTQFGFRPGSSEMPSASRGFTKSLVERLLLKGVRIVPVLLHTGVSSLEHDETPYAEYMEIDPIAAATLRMAQASGKRIIAVGTTVVRALESAADQTGKVQSFRGLTERYIQAEDELQVVNGLITGFHEPRASHLHMLQAIAGRDHLEKAYQTAIGNGYNWHEFGDMHLILIA